MTLVYAKIINMCGVQGQDPGGLGQGVEVKGGQGEGGQGWGLKLFKNEMRDTYIAV